MCPVHLPTCSLHLCCMMRTLTLTCCPPQGCIKVPCLPRFAFICPLNMTLRSCLTPLAPSPALCCPAQALVARTSRLPLTCLPMMMRPTSWPTASSCSTQTGTTTRCATTPARATSAFWWCIVSAAAAPPRPPALPQHIAGHARHRSVSVLAFALFLPKYTSPPTHCRALHGA